MNYLSFEDIYKKGILNGQIIRTLRYGDRTIQSNGKLPFHPNEILLIKFKCPPYDRIPPEYDEKIPKAKINSLILGIFHDIRLEKLVRSDLQGLSRRLVKEKLGRLYSKKIEDWDIFTLVEFELV